MNIVQHVTNFYCNHLQMKHKTNYMEIKLNSRLESQLLEQHQNERSKCLVFTRVMGYHRPVESFNIGKKGEHTERKHFIEHGCD